jgi:hypothetical protein
VGGPRCSAAPFWWLLPAVCEQLCLANSASRIVKQIPVYVCLLPETSRSQAVCACLLLQLQMLCEFVWWRWDSECRLNSCWP